MNYQEQRQLEQLNKQIFDGIVSSVPANDFIDYYVSHNQKETLEHFGLRNVKQLRKILEHFNYDFTKPKPSKFKGKASARSHESYIEAGKKSAATQRATWANKTEAEKEAWAQKQSLAHLNSPTFKEKITASNKAYRESLSAEEEARQNELRRNSMKAWWANLSEEEKITQISNINQIYIILDQNKYSHGVKFVVILRLEKSCIIVYI